MTTKYSLERDFLVTGATSGLGRALVRKLAPVATGLLITGRNAKALLEAETEARSLGAKRIWKLQLDLGQDQAGTELAKALKETLGARAGAILNAGFSLNQRAWEVDENAQREELAVNARSILDFLIAIRPKMMADGGGLILFTSSIAGMAGIPEQSGYAAAKSFSLSLGQSLHHEFKDIGVGLTTYRAGLMETDFFRRAGLDRNRRWGRIARFLDPDDAADFALRQLKAGRMLATQGCQNRVLMLLHRFLSRRSLSALNAWAVEA